MSDFKSQVQADEAVFFNTDEFAEDAYFNGSATPVPVLVEFGDGKTRGNASTALVAVPRSALPAPEYQDTVVINGETWTVDRPQGGAGFGGDDHVWHLPVIRNQKVGSWRI